jgi:hypothetical protein
LGGQLAISLVVILSLAVPHSSKPNDTLAHAKPASPAGSRFLLDCYPDPVSLGVLSSGQKSRTDFTLVNRTSQPLTIERIETSCPCLTTALASTSIGPGEKKVLSLEFDSSAEPDFHGGLSMDVTGFSSGVMAFHLLADVEIRAASTEHDIRELVPVPSQEAHPCF